MKRIIADIILLALLAFFPPYICMVVGIVFAFIFPYCIELLFAGIALDMIGSAPVPILGGNEHFYLILAAVVLAIAFILRRFLRIYQPHE